MTCPEWYSEWRHAAVHELMEKNAVLNRELRMSEWPRYDYDVEERSLTFSDGERVRLVGEIQVVGTIGRKDWLWAWGNEHWPPACYSDIEAVKAFGEANGIEELTTAYLEDEDLDGLGWEMTAVAARLLGAVGAYRPPSEPGALFLVLKSLRAVA